MLNNVNLINKRRNMQGQSIDERLEICYKCPIYSKLRGGRCNANLWLNPQTNEVSTYAKIGYVRGCNCFVKIKARNPREHCVAGKW